MAEEVLRFRRVAEHFYSENEELRKTICGPFIIAMKGDPGTGRKLTAFLAASILRCPLIKEHDFDGYEGKKAENQARIWRKICKLASSQLNLGQSVVIDTELANKNEFDILKEFSEINKTPLAVFECQVDNAELFWRFIDSCVESKYSLGPIAFEFLEKPTSDLINPTKYSMGEIIKIPVEIIQHSNHTTCFDDLVPYALKDLRDHIHPNFESEETNYCGHVFLLNIVDKYQRRCWKCRQLVSGSFFRCRHCRLIVHRTCCYFPEFLTVDTKYGPDVTLNLGYVVPELDADATCSCCKQLLNGQYYSSKDELSLFCLDCLILLPAIRTAKFHEHELERTISTIHGRRCVGCAAKLGKNTIFYFCMRCYKAFDVYCLWLPETAVFDRHKHPFKLTVIPREDDDPYYCHVCENERNTECWLYYCAECDYPSHPRCIVEESCLLRSLITQTPIINKMLKEKPTRTEFQDCSYHLSSEKAMVKDLSQQHSSEPKEVPLLFKELLKENEIELPILIATKGQSDTGRKLVASILATILDCLLIDEDNMCEVTNISNEPKEVCSQEFSRVALSQLQIGLSVVIDLELSHKSEILFLRELAIATETPLFIVECKLCDEDMHEGVHKVTNLRSDYEDNVWDTPKLFVNVSTPTFDGITELMPHILHSISAYSKQWRKRYSRKLEIPYCYRHIIALELDYDVSEGEICNRCSKQLSTPILRCQNCALVLHKNCTELPLRIQFGNRMFILDTNDKGMCNCCNEFVTDRAYSVTYKHLYCLLCLDCLFTPPRPSINLHQHPMQLTVLGVYFKCLACGSYCKSGLCYICTHCDFEIGVKCGLLEEMVTFDRHRHPFHLIISPEHVSDQYYCEVCGEERDKNHWVYCCVECDYFIHVRCLVPTGGCPFISRVTISRANVIMPS